MGSTRIALRVGAQVATSAMVRNNRDDPAKEIASTAESIQHATEEMRNAAAKHDPDQQSGKNGTVPGQESIQR